jgi:hypothetical protein
MYVFCCSILADPGPGGGAAPLAVSFDEASQRLAGLRRMFLEPDGSFVWVGGGTDRAWQIDGQLHDQGQRLWSVDLKGRCPPGEFDRLLAVLGWPAARLKFHTLPEGRALDEGAFRKLALAGRG